MFFTQKIAKHVIGIGASNALAVMTQRTLALKYETHDAVHSIQWRVLT